ncbi:glycoside hydrolase family 2 protein [candidate division KSB1 bacterium]|nr:glycoside hydrolase family 2 protein [candidate division KSB1 bacterium]
MHKKIKSKMTRQYLLRWFVLTQVFLTVITCSTQSIAKSEPENNEVKPWTRWWWQGNSVNKKDLTEVMEAYKAAGIGGLEITPIYGVRGREEQFVEYLSPEWMELLNHTLKEAERLNLGIDMATGTGWPFGGPWIGAADACKNMVYKTYNLNEGEKLTEKISFEQQPMVYAIRKKLDISELKEPISSNENLQELALEQVRFKKALPLQILMAYSDKGDNLDITSKVNADGELDWIAPPGKWTLYAVFQGWHGKMVERAAPGGEGNVIDHFSETALKNYLQKFDSAFRGYRDLSVRAFFNDSYEVDDARGESDYTPDLFAEFKKRRGYDLRLYLPALFENDDEEKISRVRCDYRETISDLLLEKFTTTWKEWAKSHNAIVRNQAHGSPANILDLYAASDIPETEGNEILRFKFATSAGHVAGKKLISAETATWLKDHFQASLADVKSAVDNLLLAGVNHIVYHGAPYSPPDEQWPGWLFYAAVHFGPTNSFWNDFPALNQYVANCQTFLQSGAPDNDVLLYFPIYDKWSEKGRSLLQHFSGREQDYEGTPFQYCAETMWKQGYSYDIISDRQVCNLQFNDNMLQSGESKYKIILIPAARFIPVATFEKLIALAREGATILIYANLPEDVPGLRDLEKRRAQLKKIFGELAFNRIDNSNVQQANIGAGRFILANDVDRMLAETDVKREAMVDDGLKFIKRKQSDGTTYFIVNTSDIPIDGYVTIAGATESATLFNLITGAQGNAKVKLTENGKTDVYVQLASGESLVLNIHSKKYLSILYPYTEQTGESQTIRGTWSVNFISGGPELPEPVETNELDSWTNFGAEALNSFSGTAVYKISFEKPEHDSDGWMLDLGQVHESAKVILNSNELATLIGPPYRVIITRDKIQQNNELIITVSNLMANRIADMDRRGLVYKKFYNVNFPAKEKANLNDKGLFDASRWPPRDSGLMGPVTLAPVKFKKKVEVESK